MPVITVTRTNNKLNPHMTPRPGVEPGPHCFNTELTDPSFVFKQSGARKGTKPARKERTSLYELSRWVPVVKDIMEVRIDCFRLLLEWIHQNQAGHLMLFTQQKSYHFYTT